MSDFDRGFGRMNKQLNWFFRFVLSFIILCFVAVIGFWVFVAMNIDKAPEIIGETAARIENSYEGERD